MPKSYYKNAKIRKSILTFLQRQKKPLTAMQILAFVRGEHPTANKTSVYRSLEILSESQQVSEISFGDRNKRYETASLGHHHHLVCKSCYKIEDVFLRGDLAQVEKRLLKDKKFSSINHSLEFFGICKECN